jgi:hypothetical protein
MMSEPVDAGIKNSKSEVGSETNSFIETASEFRKIVTVAASALFAFVGACIAHEVVGHSGACLIGGGIVAQVSSSLFKCDPGTLISDLGGPGANLIAGLISLIGLRGRRRGTALHLVLAFSAAFNMFWLAGELIISAVLARDDFAYAARSFGAARYFVRAIFGAGGISLAIMTCRLLAHQGLSRNMLRLAYCVVGTAVCLSAGLHASPIGPALREAAFESFGGMAWLLCVRPRPPNSNVGAELGYYAAPWTISLLALIALGLLLAIGHGYAV